MQAVREMDDGAGAGARILAERLSEKRCSKRSALAPFGVTRCEAELPAGDGLSSAPGQDFAGADSQYCGGRRFRRAGCGVSRTGQTGMTALKAPRKRSLMCLAPSPLVGPTTVGVCRPPLGQLPFGFPVGACPPRLLY